MRLLTLLPLLLFSLTLSAQACVEGEGLLTSQTVQEASCLEYRTVLTLEDGTPYTVVLTASVDSVTVAKAVGRRFQGKETWARTAEGTGAAVFIYNGTITLIREQRGF